MSSIALLSIRFYFNEYSSIKTHFEYEVQYKFNLKGDGNYSVRTYLPVNNDRQQISISENIENTIGKEYFEDMNKLIVWQGLVRDSLEITQSFVFRGKHLKFKVDREYEITEITDTSLIKYIQSGHFIQSDSSQIIDLANSLVEERSSFAEHLDAYFDYVYDMPTRPINQMTDALTALEHYEASCNGKSRLFVALCRSQGIPSRVVGGIILEDGMKKTSHLWVEVYIKNKWVPFDPLNGYFAEIPSNYLELYKGDEFIINRSANIDFDYIYMINKSRKNTFPKYSILDLWEIIDKTNINLDFILILLLLPLGAFIVALFKNIVGLKTFGIFLPVLIAFAFIETGWIPGLILFTGIVLCIGILNYPLDKWGVLHTPKMVFMLSTVVIVCLISIRVLFDTNITDPSVALYFPIIILTITAERFARKIEEENFLEALIIYGQTILVTMVCMLILSSDFIRNFIISFPEALLSIAGLSLLLGKWIGLRLTEYSRFYNLTSKKIDDIK